MMACVGETRCSRYIAGGAYPRPMETTFTGFDGDFISISGQTDARADIMVINRDE
jgi:hypothetical protein